MTRYSPRSSTGAFASAAALWAQPTTSPPTLRRLDGHHPLSPVSPHDTPPLRPAIVYAPERHVAEPPARNNLTRDRPQPYSGIDRSGTIEVQGSNDAIAARRPAGPAPSQGRPMPKSYRPRGEEKENPGGDLTDGPATRPRQRKYRLPRSERRPMRLHPPCQWTGLPATAPPPRSLRPEASTVTRDTSVPQNPAGDFHPPMTAEGCHQQSSPRGEEP